MKSLFFILLAGYAVRSDENNYYVIEMPDDPPIQTKKFNVYWNVPTMQCSSKKIHFENLYEDFGIIQNDRDRFKGEKITILYDPGLFPALFKNETSGKFRFRNGGVPQEGDLTKHLDAFKKELDHSIPDESFSGVGIIDFESWRPVFRQNFGVLQPYKDVSIEIERKLHWWWKKAWIEAEAKRRFEESARTYMQTTLAVAKQLRPRARWGFYGFPYCFNMASNNMVESCASNVPEENDRIPWLWSESTALYPSVYSSSQLSTSQLESLIRGRIREAARCAKNSHRTTDILPYFWFRYRDAGFLTETDLDKALSTLYESNATGILIWGSSNDVNTAAKCNKLLNYVNTVLGPAIAKYTKPPNKLYEENFIHNTTRISNNNVTTDNPVLSDTSTLTTKMYQDPEYHWNPPENYSEEIINNVEEEINRRFGQNATGNHNKYTVLKNNSVLIDLILNTVLINLDNVSSSTETPKTKSYEKGLRENEDVDDTTEITYISSTDTSQVTSSSITNNPLLDEVNNISPEDLQGIDFTNAAIFRSDEATTEITVAQTTPNNETSVIFEYGNSIIEVKATENAKFYVPTDDYDAVSNEDEYFFNVDTFINDVTTESTDGGDGISGDATTETANLIIRLTKKNKKEFQASLKESNKTEFIETDRDISTDATTTEISGRLQDESSEFIKLDSTVKNTIESIENSTAEFIESNTNLLNTMKYIDSTETIDNQTEISTSKTTLTEALSSETVERSTYKNDLTTKLTQTEDNKSISTGSSAGFTDTESLEVSKMTSRPSATDNKDYTEESDFSKSEVTEETTSIVPTTEQVDI